MNRIIKVSRVNDPQSPDGISIRVEIYGSPHGMTSPISAITMTTQDAIELASILHLLQYNNSILSLTGSVGGAS